jgi:hypothetical protein
MQAAAPPFGGLAIRIELPRHTGPKHLKQQRSEHEPAAEESATPSR